MKKLTQDNISDFQVENYVHLLIKEKNSLESVKRQINGLFVDESEKQKALQRLQFAVERIDKPLTAEEVIIFLFIPFFGYIKRFSKPTIFNLDEERKLGYVNRVKQFFLISTIGLILYMLIIPGIYLSFK